MLLTATVTPASHYSVQNDDDGQSYLFVHLLASKSATPSGTDHQCIAVSRGHARFDEGGNFTADHCSIDRQGELSASALSTLVTVLISCR